MELCMYPLSVSALSYHCIKYVSIYPLKNLSLKETSPTPSFARYINSQSILTLIFELLQSNDILIITNKTNRLLKYQATFFWQPWLKLGVGLFPFSTVKLSYLHIHLQLCLATTTHSFKWLKINHIFRPNICKSWCLNTHLFPNDSDFNLFIMLIKQMKNDPIPVYVRGVISHNR